MMRRAPLLLAALLLAAPAAPGDAGDPVPRAEYEVKAEFILRIAQFVDWPAPAHEPASAAAPSAPPSAETFTLCTIGENPFGAHLRRIATGAPLHGRPAAVREATETTLDGCRVLFIGANRAQDLERLLALVAERDLLTVADSPGFCRRGVMINFYIEAGRIRFEANPAALQRSRLRAGARLLQLARIVE